MKRKGVTRRVTKKHKEKMRTHFVKKKKKYEYDQFCVAFLKMVNNNGMFKACRVEEKPEESCEGCVYNRRKKRAVNY